MSLRNSYKVCNGKQIIVNYRLIILCPQQPQIKISNRYECLLSEEKKTEFVDEISPNETIGINNDVREKEKSRSDCENTKLI